MRDPYVEVCTTRCLHQSADRAEVCSEPNKRGRSNISSGIFSLLSLLIFLSLHSTLNRRSLHTVLHSFVLSCPPSACGCGCVLSALNKIISLLLWWNSVYRPAPSGLRALIVPLPPPPPTSAIIWGYHGDLSVILLVLPGLQPDVRNKSYQRLWRGGTKMCHLQRPHQGPTVLLLTDRDCPALMLTVVSLF